MVISPSPPLYVSCFTFSLKLSFLRGAFLLSPSLALVLLHCIPTCLFCCIFIAAPSILLPLCRISPSSFFSCLYRCLLLVCALFIPNFISIVSKNTNKKWFSESSALQFCVLYLWCSSYVILVAKAPIGSNCGHYEKQNDTAWEIISSVIPSFLPKGGLLFYCLLNIMLLLFSSVPAFLLLCCCYLLLLPATTIIVIAAFLHCWHCCFFFLSCLLFLLLFVLLYCECYMFGKVPMRKMLFGACFVHISFNKWASGFQISQRSNSKLQ